MLKFHEVASIFPLMEGEEYQKLKSDIAQNGQLEPIWLHPDGRIIDGRNRYRACLELNITPCCRQWDGNGSLVSFVVSLNLKRRHLSSGQQAAVAVEILPLLEEEAKKRQQAAQNNNAGRAVKEKFPELVKGQSRDQAASITGTNSRYVSDAKKLKQEYPDLFEELKAGTVNVEEAKLLQKMPQEERQQVIRKVLDGKTSSVRKEFEKKNVHVSNCSGEERWFTPVDIIEKARSVMGSIDVDPASCEKANKNVKAKIFYSKEDNGLDKTWNGNVWLNPPYGQPAIFDFCKALTAKVEKEEVIQAIVLVNNATETQWFQLLLKYAVLVCFPEARIKFLDKNDNPTGHPLQGQAIFYFGHNRKEFFDQFTDYGAVLSRVQGCSVQ